MNGKSKQRVTGLCRGLCFLYALVLSVQTVASGEAVLSAEKSGDAVVVTSVGGAVSYKAVVDPRIGGDIGQVRIPADGQVASRELNDLFYLGAHGEEYTLRGWTGRDKFVVSCAVELVSRKPDEVVVSVALVAKGTFKVLVNDEAAKAAIRKTHVSYKDKTIDVRRKYTFKADRVIVEDDLKWLYPDMEMRTFYFTAAFVPGSVQGPVRMVKDATRAGFLQTTSGGKKVPEGIAFPFTAENFLKNGIKVSVRNTAASFDVGKSDTYFYEKAWQQDWFQLSGFMYRLPGYGAGRGLKATHEVVFSKATTEEMPPVVTIRSPGWDARWMDEKGEVARYKIGDRMGLSASAMNSDGSAVPDRDISWEIHIDPWWKTPPVKLLGANLSYTLPEVANEEDKATSKDRNLLAVINVRVRGKNGTEAVEGFAMLVGRAGGN